jgi:hypothetical protein
VKTKPTNSRKKKKKANAYAHPEMNGKERGPFVLSFRRLLMDRIVAVCDADTTTSHGTYY